MIRLEEGKYQLKLTKSFEGGGGGVSKDDKYI